MDKNLSKELRTRCEAEGTSGEVRTAASTLHSSDWTLCASLSFGPVLDEDSVHAFNDTVDLFTALGVHARPRIHYLSRAEPCELRHRSCAAGLCNTISLDM